jgi:hypothetical protein
MDEKKEEQEQKAIVIEYNISENVMTRYATHMVVQTIENEFKISFFEVKIPIILTDQDREKFNETRTMKADCIASVIITSDRLPRFLQALNEHLSKYMSEKEKKDS